MTESFQEITWGKGDTNYPSELLKNIRPDDEVMAFIRIVEKERGCLKKKSKNTGNSSFIAITRERVVGTAEVAHEVGGRFSKDKDYEVVTMNIPLVKITSIETSNSSQTVKGCLHKSKEISYSLRINAQGQSLSIYTGKDSTVNDEFVRSFLEISDYF